MVYCVDVGGSRVDSFKLFVSVITNCDAAVTVSLILQKTYLSIYDVCFLSLRHVSLCYVNFTRLCVALNARQTQLSLCGTVDGKLSTIPVVIVSEVLLNVKMLHIS